MIRLRLETRGPDHAKCGTLIVGLHSGERPPRGEAGWLDWRLGGALSRAILAGRVDGARGTAVLMPAAKLPCARVIVVGMGAPSDFKGRELGAAVDLALSKIMGLGELDFAIALPGTKPYPPPKDSAEVIGERLLGTLATAAREAKITLLGPAPLLLEVAEWVRGASGPVTSHVVLDEQTVASLVNQQGT